MRFSRFGAILFLGLLAINGVLVVQSAHNPSLGASTPVIISTRVELLAADQNTTNSSLVALSGVWQDGANTNITYRIIEHCFVGSPCEVYATYLTDPQCSSAVGMTFLTNTPISGNPPSVGNDTMFRCTPATNAIVENCSQNAIWDTTFNATFSNSTITGQFIGQYWTWNTSSSGDIEASTCHESYDYAAGFALNRVPSNSTSFSSATTSQSSGSPNPPSSGQGSSPSKSKSSTNSTSRTNSSSTTSSTKSGPLGIEILAAVAAVAVVSIATAVIFLRKRP